MGTTMGIKQIAAIGALVLASTSAFANNVTNNITGLGGTTFFGALHTDNLDFTDVFTFSVADAVQANASLITIGSGLNNIDFTSADLNGTPLILSPNGFVETGALGDTNLTGPLVLTVQGKSGAAGGTFASYSGTMNIAIITPIPGAIWLFASGLTALAAGARRRG
jgi:hypothetical protein